MASLEALDPNAIRRNIPIPLHYQLSELLNQEIEAGRWKVGEQIPVEEELCSHFSLSRTTVRKALDALVNTGLLQREQGRGTFVAEPKLVEGLVNRPVGFFDDMAERGIHVVSHILELREIKPPPTVARELELGPGETAVMVQRVRYIRNEPVLTVTSYLSYQLCSCLLHADLTNTGLYTYMREHCGYKMGRANRFVEAVAANEQEARQLEVAVGSPLLLIESTVYLEDGRPFDYFKARHRGDRLRLIIENVGYDHVEIKK